MCKANLEPRASPSLTLRCRAKIIIEIINITRAGMEGKIWERICWGTNQRKSNVLLEKRPLNYDINNENTNTFINVKKKKKTQ